MNADEKHFRKRSLTVKKNVELRVIFMSLKCSLKYFDRIRIFLKRPIKYSLIVKMHIPDITIFIFTEHHIAPYFVLIKPRNSCT